MRNRPPAARQANRPGQGRRSQPLRLFICGSTGLGVLEASSRPKEVVVPFLPLKTVNTPTIEQLSLQYVDQRRSFAKLVTSVKQTALKFQSKWLKG